MQIPHSMFNFLIVIIKKGIFFKNTVELHLFSKGLSQFSDRQAILFCSSCVIISANFLFSNW